MRKLQIAFFPILRSTFDVPFAMEKISQARQALRGAGYQLHEPGQPISDLEGARETAREFSNREIDLAIIFQSTFADSTMVVECARSLSAPLFLWGVPEPWTGERLRLNSLCGINLAGHALTLRGIPYDYAFADPGAEGLLDQVRDLARVGFLRRRLKAARLGVVGEHPAGMDTCHLDEERLKNTFGVEIERVTLEEVFNRARTTPRDALEGTRAQLDSRLDNLAVLEQAPLNGTLSAYHALKGLARERKLDGLAVRCWPEFFTDLGCAACGAMSMLSDGFGLEAPLPCSCEADINGTLTQLMLQLLAEAPAFGTDIVGVDPGQDRIALWHCGLAPLAMADPGQPVRGGVHSNRKVPLVMEFTLKPGNVTFARISQATGELRLVLGTGEMLAAPKPFSGTAGTMKPAIPAAEFLDRLMFAGLEHHISLAYGTHLESLKAFARLARVPILMMNKEVIHDKR